MAMAHLIMEIRLTDEAEEDHVSDKSLYIPCASIVTAASISASAVDRKHISERTT
jgi:hypothetical protein